MVNGIFDLLFTIYDVPFIYNLAIQSFVRS